MILFDRCRVALFTAEGKAKRERDELSIGPLILKAVPGGSLHFRGPAVIVDDGTAYLSVERALASSRLDRMAEVEAVLEFNGVATSFDDLLMELDELFAAAGSSPSQQRALSLLTPPRAAFGQLHGTVRLNDCRRSFHANFRLGASFTGLGPQKFISRKMVWSNFPRQEGHEAFEARALELDDHSHHRIARVLRHGQWSSCDVSEVRFDLASSLKTPERIAATATSPEGDQLFIEGEPGTFVMLSRPGPDGTRLHTVMGFAEFILGNSKGAGMYEFSKRVGLSGAGEESEDTQDG